MNRFPKDFPFRLGREIVYLLASRKQPRLEGQDWEEIFAAVVGAEWRPLNVGLDDVVLDQTAWGAKTVKQKTPSAATSVRLISGRNSPVYSYGDREISECDPDALGAKVLEIWNERVAGVRKLYRHLRTVVLIKSYDLLEVAAFEFETILFNPEVYYWQWNRNNNLVGFSRDTDQHMFTWQPHGSQFTIIETVPKERLVIRIRKPPPLEKDTVLRSLGFDSSWVEVVAPE